MVAPGPRQTEAAVGGEEQAELARLHLTVSLRGRTNVPRAVSDFIRASSATTSRLRSNVRVSCVRFPVLGSRPTSTTNRYRVRPSVQGGIVAGRRSAHPANSDKLVRAALDAATSHVRDGADLPDFRAAVAGLEAEVPPLDVEGIYYWQHRGHGGTFTSTTPDQYEGHEGMQRIDLREYLEHAWGVSLDELPVDVRAQAEKVMPA